MRILVVSPHPLTTQDPSAVTFESLFSAIQKPEVRQIVIGNPVNVPNLVEGWRIIGSSNVYIEKLVRSIIRAHAFKTVSEKTVRDAVKTNSGKQRLLTAYADAMPISFSEEDSNWVRDFAPQVVYSTLGSIRCLQTVRWVSQLLNVSIVVHYMDDWLSTQYCSPFTWIPRKILLHLNKKIIEQSASRLAISLSMARHYEKQFAYSFDNFMHCVDIPTKSLKQPSDILRMAYVGGLHLEREKVLARFGRIVQNLNGKIENTKIFLDCYAPEAHLTCYRNQLEEAGIRCVRSLQPHEVTNVIADYDCLIHAESFDKHIYQYTKFSISTKIPGYLAAGLPILAIGPKQQAAVEYVCTNGAGIGVYDLSEANVISALQTMINKNRRAEMSNNAYNLAATHHNKAHESIRFRNILEQASSAL